MLYLRNRRQDEGIKRFEVSLANSPVGYYWGVHIELSPEILWIGDHTEQLKTKLAAINYNTTDLHALVAEVIAPEVVTHLILKYSTTKRWKFYGTRQHGNTVA
jgi:hypothetical protein